MFNDGCVVEFCFIAVIVVFRLVIARSQWYEKVYCGPMFHK